MDFEDKVPAVTKAIAIVRHINEAGSAGTSLIDISVGLGITKSHCYNILKGLTRAGWLVHDDARHGTAGAARTRSSLRPPIFRGPNDLQASGASRRERERVCGIVIANRGIVSAVASRAKEEDSMGGR